MTYTIHTDEWSNDVRKNYLCTELRSEEIADRLTEKNMWKCRQTDRQIQADRKSDKDIAHFSFHLSIHGRASVCTDGSNDFNLATKVNVTVNVPCSCKAPQRPWQRCFGSSSSDICLHVTYDTRVCG